MTWRCEWRYAPEACREDFRIFEKVSWIPGSKEEGWLSLARRSQASVWHYVGGPPSRRSLCLFWRETRQRVWTRDFDATGSRKGIPVGSWKKEPREVSWRQARQKGTWQSTPDSRRDQSAWDRFQQRWGKTSHDELAFLVALLEFCKKSTIALVYRCTKEHTVSQNHPRLFFVLFLPLPWLYFCSLEEMCPYRNH